MNFTG